MGAVCRGLEETRPSNREVLQHCGIWTKVGVMRAMNSSWRSRTIISSTIAIIVIAAIATAVPTTITPYAPDSTYGLVAAEKSIVAGVVTLTGFKNELSEYLERDMGIRHTRGAHSRWATYMVACTPAGCSVCTDRLPAAAASAAVDADVTAGEYQGRRENTAVPAATTLDEATTA
jgi:hypothetical protein